MLIYTDGACSGNPGPGGWAYVIADDNSCSMEEKNGAEKNTTNNRMELTAVISALESIPALMNSGKYKPDNEIKIFTDSQYVQKGMCVWIKDWKARGWKTAGKDPVKNQDLWQRLDDLVQGLPVSWHWVKGHAGNVHNERCDSLANKAIASLQ